MNNRGFSVAIPPGKGIDHHPQSCEARESERGGSFGVNEVWLFACFLLFLECLRLQKSLQNEEK